MTVPNVDRQVIEQRLILYSTFGQPFAACHLLCLLTDLANSPPPSGKDLGRRNERWATPESYQLAEFGLLNKHHDVVSYNDVTEEGHRVSCELCLKFKALLPGPAYQVEPVPPPPHNVLIHDGATRLPPRRDKY
jgi:hypothetical protein